MHGLALKECASRRQDRWLREVDDRERRAAETYAEPGNCSTRGQCIAAPAAALRSAAASIHRLRVSPGACGHPFAPPMDGARRRLRDASGPHWWCPKAAFIMSLTPPLGVQRTPSLFWGNWFQAVSLLGEEALIETAQALGLCAA
ncbi:hypothetical protein MRX96_048976 [Rhipicephalus microplus]